MTRIATSTFWAEPDGPALAYSADIVYLMEEADGSLSLTLDPLEATHWFVDYEGIVVVQPWPGATTRVVLVGGTTVLMLFLEAAYVDALFNFHYMADDGSGNAELSETEPGDRFFIDDGASNWVLSNTDSGEAFLALTKDDPGGDGVRIIAVP